MTAPSAHHLGRARIGQLLAAVGTTQAQACPERSEGDQAPPQTTPYDWRDPHSFNAGQHSRLAQVLGQVATRMAEIFARSRSSPFEVSLKALTQHFAGDLCRRLELDQDHCLTFAPDKGPPCGFVSISPQTAITWVTWLLGDSDSSRDPSRALSSLEESLLSDLLTAVLEAFLAPLRAHHNLRPAGPMGKGQPNLQFELMEEVARIAFQVKTADSGEPSEIAFLLPCSRLAALAGKTAAAAPAKVSPQELSQALMEHLQEVPVTITAILASTTLTFQEILDLNPGDILLLDKPVDGLAELIVNGRAGFRGRPARSEGQQAVVIVESEAGNTQQTGTAKAPK
jgi:flagellar motor switch protein FliM